MKHLFYTGSPLRTRALAALLACGFATAAAAQEEQVRSAEGVHEGLFATGVLEGIGTDESISFRHNRDVEPDDARIPDIDGSAQISIVETEDGQREAQVALVSEDRNRPVPPLPADAGHPLLLIFLETAVRTMAEATGGSPFYIRNRIRDTLWTSGEGEMVKITYDGHDVEAEDLSYHPFTDDPNRAQMGGFADLELRFIVSDAVPGRIALLEMKAPQSEGAPKVKETLRLKGLEEEEES